MNEVHTEDLIRASARKVFTERGFSGARMQDIADAAGINRALLHYYFRSKERLFEVIFEEAFNRFLEPVQMVAGIPLFEKIERLVEAEIELCEAHPCNAMFVMHELMQNPRIMERWSGRKRCTAFLDDLSAALREEHAAGRVIKIDAEELFIHILSLILFPFIGKGYLQQTFGLDEDGYREMIRRRKKEVSRFVVHAIKVC